MRHDPTDWERNDEPSNPNQAYRLLAAPGRPPQPKKPAGHTPARVHADRCAQCCQPPRPQKNKIHNTENWRAFWRRGRKPNFGPAHCRYSIQLKLCQVPLCACVLSSVIRALRTTTSSRTRRPCPLQEAAIGILGRADDRLAADVEAGVDQHRAARQAFEGLAAAGRTGGCGPRRRSAPGHCNRRASRRESRIGRR